MPKNFPYIAFGPCTRCGRRGPDASGTDADASPLDTTGDGLDLEFFRGELMCDLCKKEILDMEHAEQEASRHGRTQEFMSRAGFRSTID